jgi:DNA polymerase-3 subunit delta
MHAFEFLKDPSVAAGKSLCAVFGDDSYLRREVLDAMIGSLLGGPVDDLAVTRFVGDRAGLTDVLDELRTLPFLVKRRVVIVEEADKFVTAHRKELEAFADRPPTPGALILSVKTWPGNTRLAKAFVKVGLPVECKTPDERELPTWLVQIAKTRSRAKLQPEAASLLLELVGPEIGLLVSEVEKLAVYVGDYKEIGREDVIRMVGAGRVETIWRTVDAMTTGQSARALADLDKLMDSGEHPVGLLAGITSTLRKLHHAGQLRRAKHDLEDASRQAGLFNSKLTGQQHAHLGPARVDRLPAMLLQADLDLKGSSSLPPETVMERLVVQLSRKRDDDRPARSSS